MTTKPVTPKGVNTPPPPVVAPVTKPKLPAMNMINEFLKRTGIELTVDYLTNCVKSVSDGSIIISKPSIGAKYK